MTTYCHPNHGSTTSSEDPGRVAVVGRTASNTEALACGLHGLTSATRALSDGARERARDLVPAAFASRVHACVEMLFAAPDAQAEVFLEHGAFCAADHPQ